MDGISSDDKKVLVAVDGEEPVGFVRGSISTPYLPSSLIERIGLIEVCWVDPKARRQGYGKQLVRELEDWFLARGITYVDVSYLVGNAEAENTWSAPRTGLRRVKN